MKPLTRQHLLAAAAAVLLLASCRKEPGRGGSSDVRGAAWYRSYDHHGKLIGETPASARKIFIAYGDNELFDDDTDTDISGNYRFKYLRKGSYRIFSQVRCDTCAGGKAEFSVTVEVGENRSVVEAERLVLSRTVAPDDGYATISGKVFADDYNVNGMPVDQYYIADERVYIVYENDSVYFEDMRTSYDGSYAFRNLIPGEYRIYAFSKCDKFDNSQTYAGCAVPVFVTDTVKATYDNVVAEDIRIIQ